MSDPNAPFTLFGDLDDELADSFWKAEKPVDEGVCVICEKKLIREPTGKLVCPIHSTRGVPK